MIEVWQNTGTRESDKIEHGMRFPRKNSVHKNLKQLMDEVNGIKVNGFW